MLRCQLGVLELGATFDFRFVSVWVSLIRWLSLLFIYLFSLLLFKWIAVDVFSDGRPLILEDGFF